jgi:hypothetical protein
MKKLLIPCLALFMNTLSALPVGNPSEASLFHYACNEPCPYSFLHYGVGFYGDYVFNRHLRTDPGRDVDTTKLVTNAGYLVLNFKERVDLFATLGASRISLNTSLVSFNSIDPFPLFEIESGTAFSYSIGGRATLFQYKCASLGIEGQYFSTKPDIKRVYIAAGAVSYLDKSLVTHYNEWQLGGGISYKYNPIFIPYIAVKYSRAHWKLADGENIIIESNTNTFFYNLHNPRHWGYALGLTLCPCECDDKIAVTAEVRFLDEKAFYINGQMRF